MQPDEAGFHHPTPVCPAPAVGDAADGPGRHPRLPITSPNSTQGRGIVGRRGSGTALTACSKVIDSVVVSGRGGNPAGLTARSTADGEDEVAGTGLLAGNRRRRQPRTTTQPVPALERPAQPFTADYASGLFPIFRTPD